MHKIMTLRQNHVRTGLIFGVSLLAMGALSGCQSAISSLPLIHKQDILQGNVLDKCHEIPLYLIFCFAGDLGSVTLYV